VAKTGLREGGRMQIWRVGGGRGWGGGEEEERCQNGEREGGRVVAPRKLKAHYAIENGDL
jgi:hypothetical protein